MWKARLEERTPRFLHQTLKQNTPKPILCKELFKQAYFIGKQALGIKDLDTVLTLITKKTKFNYIIQNFLAQQKENYIRKTFEINRKAQQPKMFYLVSKHLDSADDHSAYQGAIYVDKNYDKNDLFIKDYVKENNVGIVQNLLEKPIYMFIRPNCRHYFVALTKFEALSCDISTLLRKYNMIDTYDKDKHKKETIIRQIERYSNNLRVYNKLKEIQSTPKIIYMISHTKNILNKNKSML